MTRTACGSWAPGASGRSELANGSVSYSFISADGRRVVFSSRLGGPQTLWQVATDGGAPTQMLNVGISINSFSDIAPDGKSVLFADGDSWKMCQLPACDAPKTVAPVRGGKPRWMADGRSFTYIDGFNPSGNLWVQPIDGSSARQLTHFADGKFIGHFAWSRDGQHPRHFAGVAEQRHRAVSRTEVGSQ